MTEKQIKYQIFAGELLAIEDYITPPTTDWEKVFNDLRRKKINPTRISELTGIATSTIQSLKDRHSEPTYSVGASILEIHTRYCST